MKKKYENPITGKLPPHILHRILDYLPRYKHYLEGRILILVTDSRPHAAGVVDEDLWWHPGTGGPHGWRAIELCDEDIIAIGLTPPVPTNTKDLVQLYQWS